MPSKFYIPFFFPLTNFSLSLTSILIILPPQKIKRFSSAFFSLFTSSHLAEKPNFILKLCGMSKIKAVTALSPILPFFLAADLFLFPLLLLVFSYRYSYELWGNVFSVWQKCCPNSHIFTICELFLRNPGY